MKANVLFVEDDALSRRSSAQFLRLCGYEVDEAENGEAALYLLSQKHFEAVVSDLNLPGRLNGIDILLIHRHRSAGACAILITSCGSEEIRDRTLSLGAVYMEKPLLLNDLDTTIQESIAP